MHVAPSLYILYYIFLIIERPILSRYAQLAEFFPVAPSRSGNGQTDVKSTDLECLPTFGDG